MEKASTINKGQIISNQFVKYCKFSKAVLWKDRQISLRDDEFRRAKEAGVKNIIWVDLGKNEMMGHTPEKLEEIGRFKQEGQEPQWYFPIEGLKKKPYKNE